MFNLTQASRRRLVYSFFTVVVLLATVGVGFAINNLTFIQNLFPKADSEPANIQVDTQAVIGLMPRPWENLAQGGEEHDWRLQPLIPQVKALHPKYIRLDHIYDFYDIVSGTPGHLSFDFSKFDALLNDIKATGATPYIALSYMPPALTGGDLLAKPQNWGDWQLVVRKTIEHISGQRQTAGVYYEVWNEPDLFGNWKTYGDKNYLDLYKYAAQGADQAAKSPSVLAFKFGGPATTALYKNWFDTMAQFTQENHLRWDFLSWHRYSDDVNQYRQDMTDARTWVRDYPQLEATLEFHITEWGHDSKNDAGYDGNYGAAHTVAGSIEMAGVVEHAFPFEIQDGKDPAGQEYWGRWGLFTNSQMGSHAKPRYTALKMLNSLGTQRVQVQGKGTFVKALAAKEDDGGFQVILANYDKNGRNTENVPVTFNHIQPGLYQISQSFLNGRKLNDSVATSAASLQTSVVMPANSVAIVELKTAPNTASSPAPTPAP